MNISITFRRFKSYKNKNENGKFPFIFAVLGKEEKNYLNGKISRFSLILLATEMN